MKEQSLRGSVSVRQVRARSLEGNPLGDPTVRQTPVYLPPGYDAGNERYPIVYFLHGFTGSSLGWLNTTPFGLNVPERIDRLIASGQTPPFIGVFIDGWTSIGGSQWLNSEAIGRYQDYVARDVVEWADAELRTIPKREARALVGKSSGGYGALAMGRDHPDVFGHIACHSGDSYFEYCYLPEIPKAAGALLKAGGVTAWYEDFVRRARETKMRGDDHAVIDIIAMSAAYSPEPSAPMRIALPFEPTTGRLLPEVWARWLEHDPVRFIPRSISSFKKLSSLFIDCGTRDEFNLRWGARMVVEALRSAGVEHVHEEFEDGHMGINYRYERSLSYLAPRLANR